jgi:hypothetical protein
MRPWWRVSCGCRRSPQSPTEKKILKRLAKIRKQQARSEGK